MHHQHVWMPWRPTSMWKHWEDKVNGKRPGQFIGRGTIKEFKIYLNSCRYDSQWGRFLVLHFLKLQLVTLFQWSIGKQRWTISLKSAGRNLPQTMGIFRLLRANRWCCDYQWLITLSGHQSRNALTGALSWCWALPKLRLGLSPEGQWMGNSWLLSNPLLKTHPNYPSHLLFILSFWLSICFWCRQWLYTGTLLHLPAFCRGIYIGALRGLILCSCLGQECNRAALKQIARQITLHFEDEPFRKPVLCNL